jgi:L-threonylcarbamoyladenylate synthase
MMDPMHERPFEPKDTQVLPAEAPGAIEHAARVLLGGGLVAFPTETVYGLGALGLDAEAAARIFEAKGRPSFDPLILHIAHTAQLDLVADVSETAAALAERFWPGPLTLVMPRVAAVPDIVTSGLPTVAVRVPAHPVAHALLEAVGEPLAAPSANPFGKLSPTTAAHVAAGLGGRIDIIIDGGATMRGLESTIVSVAEDAPVLLRVGAIPAEEIEEMLGMRIERHVPTSRPATAGQLDSHYAPHTPVVVTTEEAENPSRTGLVVLRGLPEHSEYAAVEELSTRGDLTEAATNLFAALHRLDDLGLDLIIVRPVPETGLGAAIMDRMRRAAFKAAPGDDEHSVSGPQA